VRGEALPPGWDELAHGETLRLYAGAEVLFSSGKHWLHPLFDLEAFFREGGAEAAGTCLADRVTGRAAAFLTVRLGIRELRTGVLSRRAIPVLEAHGVSYRCAREVDRVLCATEDLLAQVQDVEAAWTLLQERRARALAGPALRAGRSTA